MNPIKLNSLQYALLACSMLALTPATAQVTDMHKISDSTFAVHSDYKNVALAPGEQVQIADLAGPGKITHFYITDGSKAHITRDLILEILWDDASEPSVRVPLSDFFGAFEARSIDYQSLPMQVNHYSHMSYLPMPFAKRARFRLVNDSKTQFKALIAWGIDYERNRSFATETSRLHATWARSNPTRNGLHTLLDLSGKGQYVGNFLQVNTLYKGWWGEGDTVFEIDGVRMTHTPGTEDEYGSTWGFGHTFSYPYTGYIEMDHGKNRMYRWFLPNPVRFQKSLKVLIENQRFQLASPENHGDNAFMAGQKPSEDDYTSVAFWYQEGAHPAPSLPPHAERVAPSRGTDYDAGKAKQSGN